MDEQGWHELRTQDTLKAAKHLVDQDFLSGYEWMRIQMNKYLGSGTTGNQYPLWAWYQAKNENEKRPDLRESGYLQRGKTGFRVEFEKDRSEVLLSDFELWHFVLNQSFLAKSMYKFDQFEKRLYRSFGTSNFSELPHAVQNEIEESWEKIFDLNFQAKDIANPRANKQIQATFWELNMNEVIQVDRFTAR